MIRCETAVIRWVPVFCGNNQLESLLQFVGEENDFVTVRHRQRAARQEIILKINNDQRVHYVILSEAKNLASILHRSPTEIDQRCWKAWPHASHFVAALRSK